ncbi:MAG: MerR family transcriptional regulator [Nitrospinae bacterium RIFCSPLOWO2_12_FULL_47_7]|nr:MAG: MerR family transcriptional regulator [Nitrospinae bacterium RIFCSPLOWO2_12_FULL_47_7]
MNLPITEKIFYKIGEVAEIAGVEQHVLRYWEDEFDILKPDKNRSGQRMYQKKDVDTVLEIKRLLYTELYTIAGAKRRLKESKKSNPQLEFAFDREKIVHIKNKLKRDLEAVLKMLK